MIFQHWPDGGGGRFNTPCQRSLKADSSAPLWALGVPFVTSTITGGVCRPASPLFHAFINCRSCWRHLPASFIF